MSSAYDKGYRKIATMPELPPNEPKLFRSGGAVILLVRGADDVRAADVTDCLESSAAQSSRDRLTAVAQCLGGTSLLNADWLELVNRKSLPVERRKEEVWVCVDQCTSA